MPAHQAFSQTLENDNAIILAYYRIGEDNRPGSNLRLEQFNQQIRYLLNGSYTVMPVQEIIKKLRDGDRLPPKTVGITFQGAYRSIMESAVPLLLKHKLPFTVFFSVGTGGQNNSQQLSLKELKALAKHPGVTLGLMPANYAGIAKRSFPENRRLFNKAVVAFRENFGSAPELFAYPYGEYSEEYKNFIKDQGIHAAFGLQSGAVHEESDFLALPRFVMTENYGDLERFEIVMATRPMPARDLEPKASLVESGKLNIGFTIPENQTKLAQKIKCYASNHGEIETEILGEQRIEIRPNIAPGERIRINCTAAAYNPEELNPVLSYRWLGFFLQGLPEKKADTTKTNKKKL